jgi:hypothetical protein
MDPEVQQRARAHFPRIEWFLGNVDAHAPMSFQGKVSRKILGRGSPRPVSLHPGYKTANGKSAKLDLVGILHHVPFKVGRHG